MLFWNQIYLAFTGEHIKTLIYQTVFDAKSIKGPH